MALPAKLQAEIDAAQEANLKRIAALVASYPQYREAIAIAEVGAAVGVADVMGADADGFLRELRATRPRPAPLKPPTAH